MRKGTPLTKENICFAQLLQKVGYRTAVAGKWQLPGLPPEYGFDHWSLWVANTPLPEGVEHKGAESTNPKHYNYMWPPRYWYPGIIQNGEYLPTTIDDYGPDIHSQFLIDFMLKDSGKPFFAYYPMVLTHDPFFATPDTIEPDDAKATYSDQEVNFKSNVEYVDKTISKMLTQLEENELLNNTAVIITGDNGTLGRGKGRTQEIGVWEPLIVSWPSQISNGGVRRELVDFSDIFPTLMDMAKASIPSDYVYDGRSFLPLLQGGSYNEREYIFSYKDDRQLVRDKRWLMEGDGRFFDCGENRNPRGYKLYREVSNSTEPEILEAKRRFEVYLSDKPKGAWNRVKKKTTGVERK
jgi:arylsulfatase A